MPMSAVGMSDAYSNAANDTALIAGRLHLLSTDAKTKHRQASSCIQNSTVEYVTRRFYFKRNLLEFRRVLASLEEAEVRNTAQNRQLTLHKIRTESSLFEKCKLIHVLQQNRLLTSNSFLSAYEAKFGDAVSIATLTSEVQSELVQRLNDSLAGVQRFPPGKDWEDAASANISAMAEVSCLHAAYACIDESVLRTIVANSQKVDGYRDDLRNAGRMEAVLVNTLDAVKWASAVEMLPGLQNHLCATCKGIESRILAILDETEQHEDGQSTKSSDLYAEECFLLIKMTAKFLTSLGVLYEADFPFAKLRQELCDNYSFRLYLRAESAYIQSALKLAVAQDHLSEGMLWSSSVEDVAYLLWHFCGRWSLCAKIFGGNATKAFKLLMHQIRTGYLDRLLARLPSGRSTIGDSHLNSQIIMNNVHQIASYVRSIKSDVPAAEWLNEAVSCAAQIEGALQDATESYFGLCIRPGVAGFVRNAEDGLGRVSSRSPKDDVSLEDKKLQSEVAENLVAMVRHLEAQYMVPISNQRCIVIPHRSVKNHDAAEASR